MEKTISVLFQINGSDTPVVITYIIKMEENIQTISCSVDKNEHKNWLQLNKFELKSQFSDGIYVALFNEAVQKKNMATALFIDKVYSDIMTKEKMKMNMEYMF